MWQHFNRLFMCIPSVISYRSSSAVQSLTVFRLICSLTHFNQTHEIPGAVQFLILALSSGIVCHFFVCHAWTVERQTTVNSPTHFHLFPAVFRSLFINVCVDKCDVGEFLNDSDCESIFPGCYCRKLLVMYEVCGFVIVT